MNAISALIGTSLDLDHFTDEILAQIHKIIAFDSATLYLLKGDVLGAAAYVELATLDAPTQSLALQQWITRGP